MPVESHFHAQSIGDSDLRAECVAYHLLSFAQNRLKMRLADETFGINFVDILRARGPSCKPPILSHHLETPDRSLIARSFRQLLSDGFARQVGFLDRIR